MSLQLHWQSTLAQIMFETHRLCSTKMENAPLSLGGIKGQMVFKACSWRIKQRKYLCLLTVSVKEIL